VLNRATISLSLPAAVATGAVWRLAKSKTEDPNKRSVVAIELLPLCAGTTPEPAVAV
jgi:hypothetical protein